MCIVSVSQIYMAIVPVSGLSAWKKLLEAPVPADVIMSDSVLQDTLALLV